MNRNARAVEATILADLRPVRPLAPPWKRGVAVYAVGLLLAAVVSVVFGVRRDAPQLGALLLWGCSALQAAGGVALIAVALREAVPGRSLPKGSPALILAGSALLLVAITLATWSRHPSLVPVGREALYWRVCFVTPLVAGLPALGIALILAFRAYPTRAALVGTLGGLGSALLSDASWRTFCEVTAPGHVLSSHLAAVAALTLAGGVIGQGVSWLRGRRTARRRPAGSE